MAKIKLTKNELKKQKDSLKRFLRYLPTLILKKQQLQMVIRQVEAERLAKRAEQDELIAALGRWIHLFGQRIGLEDLVRVASVGTSTGNIAGVDIPVFEGIEYEDIRYDLFATPLWTDAGVKALEEIIAIDAQVNILEEQVRLLGEELRITSQRVNLFEKVKIPEARENIRVIKIYLGDQQTAAVVRGKMAKGKSVRAS